MAIERFGLDPDNKLGLSEDDVVSLPSTSFGLERMRKISLLLQKLESWAQSSNKVDEKVWFSEQGCSCEILRIDGGGWQKGRFRIRLEFIPDNPEAFEKKPSTGLGEVMSPLHDLRSNLDI